MAITVKGGFLAAIPIAVITAAFYWVKSRKIHEDIEDESVDLIPELPKVALEQFEGQEKPEVIQRKRLLTLEEEKFVLDDGVVKERFVGDELTVKAAETCRNFIDDPVSLNKNKGDVLAENNNLIAESMDSEISDVITDSHSCFELCSQDSLCSSSPSTHTSSSTQSNPSTKSMPDTIQSLTKSEHSCNESFEGPVNGDASAEADDTDAMAGDDCVSDSGQGSDQGEVWTEETQLLVYQFHIPTKLCGRFIGTAGSFINKLKKNCTCNVNIDDIKDNVAIGDIKDKKSSKKTKTGPRNGEVQLCSVEGTRSNIDKCLNIIRDKFARNCELTLEQTNKSERVDTSMDDGSITLNLAQGILHHVFVSSIVSGGHVFLQQPEHPLFAALERLDQCMLNFYTDYSTPQVPRPIQPTSVAVAPSNGAWYRCLVVSYNSVSDSCDIKYVDYGGYETIQADQLRQIRIDFLSLPFQAIEVYLANIIPSHVENVAAAILEEIVSGQVVEAREIGHTEDGTALVHLYRREGGVTAMVNRELVDRGVASWLEDVTAPDDISPNH